jgi:hypothetical protein
VGKLYIGARVELNGVDVSDHCESVEVNQSKERLSTKNMLSVGEEGIQGLANDSFGVNLQQDFAGGEVDATLAPLYDAGGSFVVKVRPNPAAAISGTNPSYEGTVRLYEYPPISGAVGELAKTQITLPVDGKISRVTTP